MENFEPEMITIEEFADRMKISRTTVFEWIKKDRLKAGKHYIKIGRIVRFEWGPDLLRLLHEDTEFDHPVEERQAAEKPQTRKKRPTNRKTSINWDY